MIAIEVSPGEVIDRLTILDIKIGFGAAEKTPSIRVYAEHLREQLSHLPSSREVDAATALLRRCNGMLWRLEDLVRDYEKRNEFGPRFVTVARLIPRVNDRRAYAKRVLNELLGSAADDVKMYS